MAAKPDDKTFEGKPVFAVKDTYTEAPLGSRSAGGKEAAVEVSQGAWRERAFTPRVLMGTAEILEGLGRCLQQVLATPRPSAEQAAVLRDSWLEYLRQAIEQAGGDSLDTWLTAVLKPPGKQGINLMLVELYVNFDHLRRAADPDSLAAVARGVIESIRLGLEEPARRKISLKVLERELEGKIEVDGLLKFLLSSEHELQERAAEIGSTMERLRAELKTMPGAKPDGMYSNFARLKGEARVIDGELKRRARNG